MPLRLALVQLWGCPLWTWLCSRHPAHPYWGRSELCQSFEDIVLCTGWDWQCFEPVAGFQTPGKSSHTGLGWASWRKGIYVSEIKWIRKALSFVLPNSSGHTALPQLCFAMTFWRDFARAAQLVCGRWEMASEDHPLQRKQERQWERKILLKAWRWEIVLVRIGIKLKCCSGCYFRVNFGQKYELLIARRRQERLIPDAGKWHFLCISHGWICLCVFIQCSHLSKNEHALLIQINWVWDPSEMSELLFLKKKCSFVIFKSFE